MAEVESNLPAAAEEKRAPFPCPAGIKASWEKRVAEGASEEKRLPFPSSAEVKAAWEKRVAEGASEEEDDDLRFACQASCFRDDWNKLYSRYFGRFEDTTKIPNMRFTYKKSKPHHLYPVPTGTLQIFSVKVARIRGDLQWPLHVFGMAAVRDVADHNRNIIFDRPRESCQILTREAPYLKLTGPTRAVGVCDPVTFEVDLKVKGSTESEDKCLSFLAVTYIDFTALHSHHVRMDYPSKLSTLQFELGSIVNSVEATISVRVRKGLWPDGLRAQFAARTASIGEAQVVLLDSGDDTVHISRGGSISLSRCVASVEISGNLEVIVEAGRGEETAIGKRFFKPKKDNVSHGIIGLGFCTLDITVAWSLVSPFM
ncbi:hypothetical protein HU200_010492 [Digitaria exilis]|uniref:DUF6598 domain-containing protein n=1 Tax=Digitaria exilis TaxID=1010633 RepID=A0A835FJF5_9POAL|nr:hypothetical protein HU200_010492 [Digitaria exilis]